MIKFRHARGFNAIWRWGSWKAPEKLWRRRWLNDIFEIPANNVRRLSAFRASMRCYLVVQYISRPWTCQRRGKTSAWKLSKVNQCLQNRDPNAIKWRGEVLEISRNERKTCWKAIAIFIRPHELTRTDHQSAARAEKQLWRELLSHFIHKQSAINIRIPPATDIRAETYFCWQWAGICRRVAMNEQINPQRDNFFPR